MKVGDLVRINRASIGVPEGSLALIVRKVSIVGKGLGGAYIVRFVSNKLPATQGRYLGLHLQVVK